MFENHYQSEEYELVYENLKTSRNPSR